MALHGMTWHGMAWHGIAWTRTRRSGKHASNGGHAVLVLRKHPSCIVRPVSCVSRAGGRNIVISGSETYQHGKQDRRDRRDSQGVVIVPSCLLIVPSHRRPSTIVVPSQCPPGVVVVRVAFLLCTCTCTCTSFAVPCLALLIYTPATAPASPRLTLRLLCGCCCSRGLSVYLSGRNFLLRMEQPGRSSAIIPAPNSKKKSPPFFSTRFLLPKPKVTNPTTPSFVFALPPPSPIQRYFQLIPQDYLRILLPSSAVPPRTGQWVNSHFLLSLPPPPLHRRPPLSSFVPSSAPRHLFVSSSSCSRFP
ncbi:hypothetical protein LZ30DRAFT_474106 [Colletotrichum cereale]|nr:hypothetical protein LZ30DRAFT_474106 [Colletotrichum cereale]